MHTDLNEARIEAVKSATVIINGISRCLRLKDLDLLLINTLMVSPGVSIYSITNDWSERNYRHVGLMYGGGIAMLSILLMMVGCLIYLPLVIISLVFGRYIWLRRSLTLMSRSSKCHHSTLKIAKYLVLNAKESEKKSLFNETKKMSIKYTMLRYIKDRHSISGSSYLNLFTHIDSEVNFYGMLHGVIDNVLLYAVEQEVSGEIDTSTKHKKDSAIKQSHFSKNMHHSGKGVSILEKPPETTQKEVAKESMQAFTSALLSDTEDDQDSINIEKSAIDEREAQEKEITGNSDPSEEERAQDVETTSKAIEVSSPEEPSNSTEDSPLDPDKHNLSSAEAAQENHDKHDDEDNDEDDFSLDDLDDDDFELRDNEESTNSESESETNEELDELLEDIDDDTLQSLGLTEDDLK